MHSVTSADKSWSTRKVAVSSTDKDLMGFSAMSSLSFPKQGPKQIVAEVKNNLLKQVQTDCGWCEN